MEGIDDLESSLNNKVLTLLHDVWWHDVVYVLGRHFNLDTFNAVATDNSNSVLFHCVF